MVLECLKAIKEGSGLPVSVKCRVGVDNEDSYSFLHKFVSTVSDKGRFNHFIVHARKAYLNNLSPVKNRKIPPLQYERVFQLKNDFPGLKI